MSEAEEDTISYLRRLVEADRLAGKVTHPSVIALALGLGSWVDPKTTDVCNCACKEEES